MTDMLVSRTNLLKDFEVLFKTIPANVPVVFHTDLAKIGVIDKFKRPNEMVQDFETLFDEVATDRPYLIPTFNYDFGSSNIFNLKKDLGQIGSLSKYYSKNYPYYRTQTPMFNFVIKNNSSGLFSLDTTLKCFGDNSTFDTVRKAGGYIFMIGNTRNTYVHHVEEMFPIGYRYTKLFKGKVVLDCTEKFVTLEFRVRPMNGVIHYSEIDLTDGIKEGVVKENQLGLTKVIWFKASEYYNFVQDRLRKDELYLLTQESQQSVRKLSSKVGYPFLIQNCE